MRPKPKKLLDIMRRGDPFSGSSQIVNLYSRRFLYIPLRRIASACFSACALFVFLFGAGFTPSLFVMAPTGNAIFAAQNEEERQALESQLKELESQIDQYESTISSYKQQGKTLQSEIDRLNSKIAKLNLQIKAINLTITQLDRNIASTESEIQRTEGDIDVTKTAVARLIQDIYEQEAATIIEVLLANPRLSDFFGTISDTLLIKDNLRLSLQKIVALREELLDQKENLALQRSDAEALKAYQDSQKQAVNGAKQEKDVLLKATKGQESKYTALLAETKKTAAQIRIQIFRLIGGGELTFEKAYDLAKQAERATGVRAAFLLAILDRESALGQNVGRCDYSIAMHPKRDLPIFLALIEELKNAGKAPPEPILVSCANADGAYGGAMGPAQFIPSTWNIYKDKVAEITGSNPSSPWNNADAFVATGLYIKNALNACGQYSGVARERCAAARYYAGSRWQRYLLTYGERVVELAQKFQADIDILNG